MEEQDMSDGVLKKEYPIYLLCENQIERDH